MAGYGRMTAPGGFGMRAEPYQTSVFGGKGNSMPFDYGSMQGMQGMPGMQGMDAMTMAMMGYGMPMGASMGGMPAQTSAGEACQFFARSGWCKFGDECRYEHAGATGMPTAGGSFNMPAGMGMGMGKGKGKGGGKPGEKSGEACGFFLKSGWCKFGGECRHEHIAGPDTPVGVIPDMAMMSGVGQKSGEACGFFRTKGWCKWGDQCKHEHIAGPETPVGVIPDMAMMGGMPAASPSGEACKFFGRTGTCRWGDQCKHAHIAGAQ
ncbi:unnamed protein product [Polarella glacialis]|uniref:C3H1-type domain-containing protein n=1 Tax=Polarella glacialis TaxID=89957 RepID=A0A813KZN1_POLGL|nr:unnamed protein product [Polarella glacialis]